MLTRLARFGVMLVATFIILAGSYIYIVVHELKNKIDDSKIIRSVIFQKIPSLEANSIVYKQDLKDFINYSLAIEDNQSIKSLELDGKIKDIGNKYRVIEDIELAGISVNSCTRFRCIQNRKDFSKVPSNIWKALLGTEDFRFLEHRGIDPIAIARAIVVDVMAMKFIQGGSTLTQQLVKNLFLTNEKKLSRKMKEIVFAMYIENVMDKDEIVQIYLNEMFWGTYQGIYIKGFQAASLAYFDRSANTLDDFESTILISLLKGPNFYNPLKGTERLKGRADAVFKRLQGLGLFPKSSQVWTEKTWLKFKEDFTLRQKKNSFFSYYLLSQNHEIHLDAFEKLVFYNSIERTKKRLAKRIEGADIAVKVFYANKDCESFECQELFTHYSKIEREKRAGLTTEKHQVGSLLKPIVYDAFIDLGRSYTEIISTSPITLNLKSGRWKPKDYSKAKLKEMPLRIALQKSKNIPLIKVASEVGFDNLEEILMKQIPGMKQPLSEYPAQLLGALELSLEEVFVTYKKFLERKCELVKSKKVDFEDSVLNYMSSASDTTISILAREPFKNALVFGKTGTSNNGLDNWYFAFDGTNYFITWFGVDSKRKDLNLRISGASSAFSLFQDFINHRGKAISEIICE